MRHLLLMGLTVLLASSAPAQKKEVPQADVKDKKPAPSYIKGYGITRENRKEKCKSDKFIQSVLPQQRPATKTIALGEDKGKLADAFPVWEYELKPGTYRFSLVFTDAAWANKIQIGLIKKFGDEEYKKYFGELNNRGAKKTITFTLKAPEKIRIESHANMNLAKDAPWFRSFCHEKNEGEKIVLSVEDSADTDFDDLVVSLEKVKP